MLLLGVLEAFALLTEYEMLREREWKMVSFHSWAVIPHNVLRKLNHVRLLLLLNDDK